MPGNVVAQLMGHAKVDTTLSASLDGASNVVSELLCRESHSRRHVLQKVLGGCRATTRPQDFDCCGHIRPERRDLQIAGFL